MKKIITLLCCSLATINSDAQCAATANTYTFVAFGKTYVIVKEKKTWTEAAACAVSKGGKLAEIGSAAVQQELYSRLITNAGITNNQTTAPDGGGAAYVWIGGTDKVTEGTWKWDGANTGNGTTFWQGLANGSPVGGLYNNWGNEPDDYNSNQDGLALALTNWPMGVAGEWNDLALSNQLYFVIEKPCPLPAANFTAAAPANKTVAYTYTGSTPVDSVRWEFGDGNTSTTMNPSHTFAGSGNYNVCVTAYTSCGLHKFCQQSTIAANDINDINNPYGIKIFPNPAGELIRVTADNGRLTGADYQVLNMYGQEVLKGRLDNTINCAPLVRGMYVLRLVKGDEKIIYRFAKQ